MRPVVMPCGAATQRIRDERTFRYGIYEDNFIFTLQTTEKPCLLRCRGMVNHKVNDRKLSNLNAIY